MKYKVLLIEDDEIDVMMVQRAFSKASIVTPFILAKDGIEALDMLRGENGKEKVVRPLIVVLDINMPRMNGIEFLTTLRKDPELADLPVVMLTSSRSEQDVNAAFDKQVAGYLVKPLTMNELVKTVTTMTNYWNISELAQ